MFNVVDVNKWNNQNTETKEIKRGDIFWCDCRAEGYHNQNGIRPCIIVSNDKANQHAPIVTVVPITSATKKPLPTHSFVTTSKGINTVLCEQIQCVSKERVLGFMGHISEFEQHFVDRGIKRQLGLYEETQNLNDGSNNE